MSVLKFRVGSPAASGAHVDYIVKPSAAELVSFFNLPAMETDDPDDARVNARAYAYTRQDIELGKRKNARTHYRVILSWPDKEESQTAVNLATQYLENTLPKAKAIVAVHQDTDNTHAHIWIDARQTDGMKLDLSRKEFCTFDERWAVQFDNFYGSSHVEEYKSKKKQTKTKKKEARIERHKSNTKSQTETKKSQNKLSKGDGFDHGYWDKKYLKEISTETPKPVPKIDPTLMPDEYLTGLVESEHTQTEPVSPWAWLDKKLEEAGKSSVTSSETSQVSKTRIQEQANRSIQPSLFEDVIEGAINEEGRYRRDKRNTPPKDKAIRATERNPDSKQRQAESSRGINERGDLGVEINSQEYRERPERDETGDRRFAISPKGAESSVDQNKSQDPLLNISRGPEPDPNIQSADQFDQDYVEEKESGDYLKSTENTVIGSTEYVERSQEGGRGFEPVNCELPEFANFDSLLKNLDSLSADLSHQQKLQSQINECWDNLTTKEIATQQTIADKIGYEAYLEIAKDVDFSTHKITIEDHEAGCRNSITIEPLTHDEISDRFWQNHMQEVEKDLMTKLQTDREFAEEYKADMKQQIENDIEASQTPIESLN